MTSKIYLWEFDGNLLNNPLENTNYLNILGLLPTLGTEIKKRVLDLLNQKYFSLEKTSLHPNNLSPLFALENAKKQLIENLYELEQLTWESKNITIFWDDCFTNTLLIQTVYKILWDTNAERFVKLRTLDFSQPCNEHTFKVHQNSLVIFWGSLNDTYNIDHSYYEGYLAELIKMLWDDFDPLWLNNRVIWVCFWQQYIANLLWITNEHRSSVIATYRGLAQFWPSNCSLQNYKHVSRLHQELLFGLSNFWKNNDFSTFFTRTWYVDFDLLRTGDTNQVVPLIRDDITGSVVGWGTKNGNILWVQFHPEISFFENRDFLKSNIESVLPYLEQYKNHEKLIGNFNFETWFWNIVQSDIWEHFYTYAMLAYIKSIKERYVNLYVNGTALPRWKNTIKYQEALFELTKVVRQKIDTILSISKPNLSDTKERLTFLKKIDESWRLLLNSKLDWKVNRGLEEVSKVLGFYNLWRLLDKQITFLNDNVPEKKVYFFRDWWAGDGSLLKDLYGKYKGKDILFYWVGDYIYFDIYPSLKAKAEELWIPEEVIILFFEEFLEHYSKFDEWNIYTKVTKAIDSTTLYNLHKIHKSSITGTDTAMFSSEWAHELSLDAIDFIRDEYHVIEELKHYIVKNFYLLFEWYFERIYVSKFNDFNLEVSNISKVDFQVSIRATSHVDSREYMKILMDFIEKSANPGSIYIDNGIHRSYTWVPRIFEIKEVLNFVNNTKVSLIYDENTNYFTSAIIQKAPFHDEEFFATELKKWYKIVSLDEACNSTFFKLEYFIRNFIVRNFKNYDVFWSFNTEIIQSLVDIIELIKSNELFKVKEVILNLINYIATNYKSDNMNYDLIDKTVLEKYSVWWESLDQIISTVVCIPSWMNLDAKRRY